MRRIILLSWVCAFVPAARVMATPVTAPSLFAATGSMSTCGQSDTETPPTLSASTSETNCNMAPVSGTAVFSGSSSASYTALHDSASMTLTDATFNSNQAYSSYSRLIDFLYLGPNTSSVSTISFGISIDGSWSDSGLSFVKPVLSFGFDYGDNNQNAPFTQTNLPQSNGSVNTIFWTPAYPIADFETWDFFISLSLQLTAGAGMNQTASAMLNFANTVSIEYVDPMNSSGQFVSNAVIGSQALGDQPFTLGQAPEPSTLGLILFGVVAVVGISRFGVRHRSADRC